MNNSAITQKILDIENEMARTQKNKATEGHLGLLKAKLAKLRREQVDSVMRTGGSKGEGFDVIQEMHVLVLLDSLLLEKVHC